MAATNTRPKKRADKLAGLAAEAPEAVIEKPATKKPVTAKIAAKPPKVVEEVEQESTSDKLKVEFVLLSSTKSYEKFGAPEGSGCVGSFYAPKGAKRVRVLIEG